MSLIMVLRDRTGGLLAGRADHEDDGVEQKSRLYQALTSELHGKVPAVPQNETPRLYPRSPYSAELLFVDDFAAAAFERGIGQYRGSASTSPSRLRPRDACDRGEHRHIDYDPQNPRAHPYPDARRPPRRLCGLAGGNAGKNNPAPVINHAIRSVLPAKAAQPSLWLIRHARAGGTSNQHAPLAGQLSPILSWFCPALPGLISTSED
jgi:hypothetical protein